MLTSSMLPTETKYEKPMPSLQGPVEHRSAQGTRLGDEADVSFGGRGGGETGVQVGARHDEPQAVGAEDPHALELPLLLADHVFEFSAFRADLAEAGRDDHQPAGSRLAALPHDGRHGGGRRADHGQVGDVRQAGDVLVGLDALNGLPLGIDRIHHAAKTGTDQIPQDGIADARRCIAGANDGHAMRLENLVQIPNAHRPAPCRTKYTIVPDKCRSRAPDEGRDVGSADSQARLRLVRFMPELLTAPGIAIPGRCALISFRPFRPL